MQQPASSENFWNLNKEEALKNLSCSENGLSNDEAGARLKQYGYNTFKDQSRSSSIILFLLQFKSPITLLLIAAALLSMGLGDFSDAIIILVIILVSSFLGFWQEKGAANAVAELLKMVQIRCRITRDGKEKKDSIDYVNGFVSARPDVTVTEITRPMTIIITSDAPFERNWRGSLFHNDQEFIDASGISIYSSAARRIGRGFLFIC